MFRNSQQNLLQIAKKSYTMALETYKAFRNNLEKGNAKNHNLIGWNLQFTGRIKINSNDSSNKPLNYGSFGGLARNEE